MEVYVEYVIIDNLVIDILLILLALKFAKIRISRARVALSALLGTAVAVIVPLLKVPPLIKFFAKIATAFLMVLISAKFSSIRKYVFALNLFLLFTFVLGGAIFALFEIVQIDYSIYSGSYKSAFPIGAIILACFALYKLLLKAFDKLFAKRILYPFLRRCVLYVGNSEICVNGLIDSGNAIFYRGKTVCVAGEKLAKSLFASCGFCSITPAQITLNTVAGTTIMKVYEIDKMEIYYGEQVNIIYKPLIGINEKLFTADEYDIILSAEFAV